MDLLKFSNYQNAKPPQAEGHNVLKRGRLTAPLPDKHRELDLVDADLRDALRACVTGKAPWPLTLIGGPGSGKTCGVLLLHDWCGGWFATAEGLCDTVRQAMMGPSSLCRCRYFRCPEP